MILILALGIGASTAVFTLLDEVVLSPLPFDGADRLVRVAKQILHGTPPLVKENPRDTLFLNNLLGKHFSLACFCTICGEC